MQIRGCGAGRRGACSPRMQGRGLAAGLVSAHMHLHSCPCLPFILPTALTSAPKPPCWYLPTPIHTSLPTPIHITAALNPAAPLLPPLTDLLPAGCPRGPPPRRHHRPRLGSGRPHARGLLQVGEGGVSPHPIHIYSYFHIHIFTSLLRIHPHINPPQHPPPSGMASAPSRCSLRESLGCRTASPCPQEA